MEIPLSDKRKINYEIKKTINYLEKNQSPGMNYFSQVSPNIYISDYNGSVNFKILKLNKITNIINLSGTRKPDEVLKQYRKKKIKEFFQFIGDDETFNITQYFESMYEYIHKNISGKILIHDSESISRSATILCYYFLKRFYIINYKDENMQDNLIENYHTLNILKFIKLSRNCINPNIGFVRQLFYAEYDLKSRFKPLILQDQMEKDAIEKKKAKSEQKLKEANTTQNDDEKEKKDTKDNEYEIEEASTEENFGFNEKDSDVDLYD